jgi:hypothetical protein
VRSLRTTSAPQRRATSRQTLPGSGRPGSNGPPRGGAPVLFLLSYVRASKSLRQESNPHLDRTKGACLPLTLRRRRWRRRESNPLLLGASEALCHQSFIPGMRTDGVEPPQREAPRLQRGELTHAQRPRGMGWPAGIEPTPRGSRPRMLPSTPRPPRSGDDRTRTGGLSPDKRALCSSELRPRVARVGFEPTVSSS